MPTSKAPESFDAEIDAVVNAAVEQIGQIIRRRIVHEATRSLAAYDGSPVSAPASKDAATPPATVEGAPKKRMGRPPGSKNAKKDPIVAAPVSKRVRSDRSYTDADVARALEVIRSKPGLLPSAYRIEAGIDEKVWKRLIFDLKHEGKIKVTGKARTTSYMVTGVSPPASTPVATPVSKSKKAPAPQKQAKPAKKRAKASKRRVVSEGELRPVLAVIAKKPGLTSVEIQEAAGIDAKQAARVLLKLRKTKAVKVTGDKSRATYTVA